MTSSGREVLKWIAVFLMTGDHLAKVFFGGYVPVVSELGRIAFPVFAIVMAYNLAQPGADARKSWQRLLLWGIVAQAPHAMAFGSAFPLNVLLTFAVAAGCIDCIQRRAWLTLFVLALPVTAFVDYHWAGLVMVLGYYHQYVWAPKEAISCPIMYWPLTTVALFLPLVMFNGNAWALLAIPVIVLVSRRDWSVSRSRWAFYGYYVGHLCAFSILAVP